MSFFRDQLENWLKQIEVKADDVLDIGGTEKPAKGRTKSWEARYRETVLDIPTFDLNESWENIQVAPAPFSADCAFCLEVFEYVFDPMTALRNINRVMRPGGMLYISFPFVYPMHKPIGMDYLRYTEEGVRKLLDVAGFEIVNLRPRVHRSPEIMRAMYSADGMHTRHDDTVAHTGYLVIAKKK